MSDLLSLKPMGLVWGGIGVSLLLLVQVMLGTQVRENVDLVSSALGEANRAEWIPNLGKHLSHSSQFLLSRNGEHPVLGLVTEGSVFYC